MSLRSTPTQEDTWSLLQEPACPTGPELRYSLLLAALDAGWRIEEPVYLRRRWPESGPRVYHFILRRSRLSPPRILTVPQSTEIEGFVRMEGLRVSTDQ